MKLFKQLIVAAALFPGLLFFQNCSSDFQASLVDQEELGSVGTTASVRLAWDPNTDVGLTGYRIKIGTSPGTYTRTVNAGLPPVTAGAVSFDLPGLTRGQTYYFAVVAHSATGAESPNSNEVSRLVP